MYLVRFIGKTTLDANTSFSDMIDNAIADRSADGVWVTGGVVPAYATV
jgi:hypothetical protein